jgi:3-dehydroquinate synthetase
MTTLLARLGLPVDVKHRLAADVLDRIEVDKKRVSDAVRFVLVPRPGQAIIEGIALDELKRQLRAAVVTPEK